jgi:seryl-tRNA synthetase
MTSPFTVPYEGVHWYPNGQTAFTGPALKLCMRLERLFSSWAEERGAAEFHLPNFVPAKELAKLDYFRSFPHLVTFPVALPADDEKLRQYVRGDPCSADGTIALDDHAPVCDVMTPAACYHFYMLFQGQNFDAPRILTTSARCYRREATYTPLERQWCFSLREIVCLGTLEETRDVLAWGRERVDRYFNEISLPIRWSEATDPFFDPKRNPRYAAQRASPTKIEALWGNALAISSFNFHRTYFGEIFEMSRDGRPVFSACIGFGVERWMRVFIEHFGYDESKWPLPLL